MDWVPPTIMKILFRTLTVMMSLVAANFSATANDAAGNSPDAGLQRLLRDASLAVLKEGNARFVAGKSQHPNLDTERRSGTAKNGQEPVVTILTCSDSRAPVELVFDRGVGDLFVIRVAGNVAGESELATVEYGVEHLGTPLLLVMGHTKCGAVTAVVKGAELHGHLHSLVGHIQPAAKKAKEAAPGNLDATIVAAIEANVWQTVENILRQSEPIRARAKAGKVTILGAVYDIETGKVNFLGAHPGQEDLLNGTFKAEPVAHHPPAEVEVEKPTVPGAFTPPKENATAELAPFPKLPAPEQLQRNQSGRVNTINKSPERKLAEH